MGEISIEDIPFSPYQGKIVYMQCSACGEFVLLDHFTQDGPYMYCGNGMGKATGLTYDENMKTCTYLPPADTLKIPK